MQTSKHLKHLLGVVVGVAVTISISHCTTQNDPVEWKKYKDPLTGYEVWQITTADTSSEALYFYAPSFTADDRYIVFSSDRSGQREIYRCDLSNGKIVQLTYTNVGNACIHPDGQSVVFIEDWKYYKVDVHTLKKEMLVDFTDKMPAQPLFRPSLTNDGRYTLVWTRQEGDTRLFRVDLETKEILMVMKEKTISFTHPLIHPTNPDLITYEPYPDTQDDMTLPLGKRARTWILNVRTGERKPFLITPYGFRATHDSWSPLGDRFFFFEKTVPGWMPVSIASISVEGNDYTRYFTSDTIRLGHGSVSRDGKWFITDSQDPFENPLILINLEDKKCKILCWPNASIKAELGNVHVHPNFSSSSNFVIFTSDRDKTGICQVYVVPIKEIKDNW